MSDDAWMPSAYQTPRPAPQGTVYSGGYTSPASADADSYLNDSGSFTGHILAQGLPEAIPPAESRSRTRRVVIILAAGLGMVLLVGAFVAVLASSFLSG